MVEDFELVCLSNVMFDWKEGRQRDGWTFKN